MAEQLKNTVLPVNTSISRNLAPCVKNGRTARCVRERKEQMRGGGKEGMRGGGRGKERRNRMI